MSTLQGLRRDIGWSYVLNVDHPCFKQCIGSSDFDGCFCLFYFKFVWHCIDPKQLQVRRAMTFNYTHKNQIKYVVLI